MTHSVDDFREKARQDWADVVLQSGLGKMDSTTWLSVGEMIDALQPFMGQGRNHSFYPTGGGLDWHAVSHSTEQDCLEATVSDRSVEVAKPARLTFEHISASPAESFFLLELEHLRATDVYAGMELRGREELLEVPGIGYMARSVYDRGYLDHDDRGDEIPIPSDSRIVSRWLEGKILIVCKASRWNRDPSTYDGRHARMTSKQIRSIIERSMSSKE